MGFISTFVVFILSSIHPINHDSFEVDYLLDQTNSTSSLFKDFPVFAAEEDDDIVPPKLFVLSRLETEEDDDIIPPRMWILSQPETEEDDDIVPPRRWVLS